MSNKSLSEQEQRLFDFMVGSGFCTDIKITSIYDHVYAGERSSDSRVIQQYVGSIISKVNRKRPEFAIKPGLLKQTYRLIRVQP